MRALLKRTALKSFRTLGLFDASANRRRRNTLVILCYHGISLRDEHDWAGGLYIPPDMFRARLQFLKDWGANVLSLEQGLVRLRGGSLPPRSVVLTFDDGFYDFYRFALPALRDFGFPCTLYLTTHYSRFRLPIFNLVFSYLLWKAGGPAYATRDARDRAVEEQMRQVANLTTTEKDDVARAFAAKLGIDYDRIVADRMFQIMSPEEATEAAEAGIDLQLHTHRHRTPLDRNLFLREIEDNSRCITEISGRAPRHFCYPSGVTAPEFLPWLREAGVSSATTCVHGQCTPTTDPLLLPRYLDGCGVDLLDFESWLAGVR